MAKRKTKKKLSWLKNPKNRSQVFLAVLVLLGGSFFAYQNYAKWQDKHKFEQAQTSINELYSEIVAKVGQPDNYKKTNSCSRPNLKFEQGPLSCNVGVDILYGVDNIQAATNIFSTIQNGIVKESSSFVRIADSKDKGSLPSSTVSSDNYKDSKSGMECTIKYAYDSPFDTFLTLNKESTSKPLFISIGCYASAKKGYYPSS
ncbi:hypothetical protein COU91_02030 [Candidatus Saccharibacteria bacterium CG10_big_fil_rev_8_21_14_0_10_47_8]|nr:MAG: hypothetical protein COU91_02030 [Candidatus Saccharibacteria bacterium CG10_big_fil_rev_8_21_14_0_10_47_8]